MRSFGFIGNSNTEKRAAETIAFKKSAGVRPSTSLAEAKAALSRKIRAEESVKEFKRKERKRLKKTLKKSISGITKDFRKELRNIAKSIGTQESNNNVAQVRQQQFVPQEPRRRNFFEHRDEYEVYGDEGLTFFDSQKRRGSGSTGNLFGF